MPHIAMAFATANIFQSRRLVSAITANQYAASLAGLEARVSGLTTLWSGLHMDPSSMIAVIQAMGDFTYKSAVGIGEGAGTMLEDSIKGAGEGVGSILAMPFRPIAQIVTYGAIAFGFICFTYIFGARIRKRLSKSKAKKSARDSVERVRQELQDSVA